MKKLFGAFLTVLSISVHAQDSKEPYLVKSLENSVIEKVDVSTFGGSISVEGNSAFSKVEVYVTPNNNILRRRWSKEDIQQLLNNDYDLKIEVTNAKLIAFARPKHRLQNPQINISFKVFMKGNADTRLETSGGSIRLSSLKGNQVFKTSGGSLHVNSVQGKINGTTSGGSIDIKNSGGTVELVTSGGSITASQSSGNLTLNTSGGSITLNELDGDIKSRASGGSISGSGIKGKLDVHTSGGSIILKNLSCSLESRTGGGNIFTSFVSPKNFIKITNTSGTTTVELPQNNGYDLNIQGSKVSTKGMKNVDGDFGEKKVIAKVNGGGIPVQINNNSGRVNLIIN